MLTELLADSGCRQGVLFGISAALGVGKKFLEAFDYAVLQDPWARI